MTLKELISKYVWLNDVPRELLECIIFEDSWLEQNKDDYIFINGEHLVDIFLEAVKQPKTIKYNKHNVMFGHNNKTLTINDGYNDITEQIDIGDKLKVFGVLLYYYTENPNMYPEDVESFKVNKSEYENINKWLNNLSIGGVE